MTVEVPRCLVQRRFTKKRIHGVDGSTRAQEQIDPIQPAIRSSKVQRSVVFKHAVLRICAMGKEKSHHIRVTPRHSPMQWRFFMAFELNIDIK